MQEAFYPSQSQPHVHRETAVRTYQSSGDFVADSIAMSGYQYEVLHTMQWRPRQGYWRLILLGFVFAYLFPPKPEIVVVYGRARR